MRWYGSGGHNRTHGTVEDYQRIDSFAFHAHLRGDKYLHYKDHVYYPNEVTPDIVYHVQERKMEILTGYKYSRLFLSKVPGINGKGVRVFFECPHCWNRVRYLYKNKDNYMCRHCLNANYKSQQMNGMKKLRLQMESILEKLQYSNWRYLHPDINIEDLLVVPKPRYMRNEEYSDLMTEFRRLQYECKEKQLAGLLKFMPRRWLNNTLG